MRGIRTSEFLGPTAVELRAEKRYYLGVDLATTPADTLVRRRSLVTLIPKDPTNKSPAGSKELPLHTGRAMPTQRGQ